MTGLRPNERREAILEVLCKRRQETIDNLAQEFGVSRRTIRYDIEELSWAYPIESLPGRDGGRVRGAGGCNWGSKYW